MAEKGKTCRIYQTSRREWTFESWHWAMIHGFDQNAYRKVHEMPVSRDTTAEDIYRMLNLDHPDGYRGRSLSVSDVIVFVDEDGDEALYCDSIGFKYLSHDFWEEAA